jgi:hypothetical protein
MNQHATTEELLEVVFSVVPSENVATQRRGKLVSASTNPDTTIEELWFLFVRAEGLKAGRSLEFSSVGREQPFREDLNTEAEE